MRRTSQHRRHLADALVTGRMTVVVVEFLEMVDVEEDQRERKPCAPRSLPFLLDEDIEPPAIGEAGEGIGGRQLFESGVGDLELGRLLEQLRGPFLDELCQPALVRFHPATPDGVQHRQAREQEHAPGNRHRER